MLTLGPFRGWRASLAAMAFRWIARLRSRRAGIVLVYHRVGGAGGDESFEILPAVSGTVFEQQLRHLRRKYRVVPASDILQAARARRRGERFPVAITFDDDLASHVQHALPALRSEGLEATFFLGGASLARPYTFWWENLQRGIDEQLVSADELPHLDEAVVRAALERSPRAIHHLAGAIVRLTPEARSDVASSLRAAVGPPPSDSGLRARGVRELVDGGCRVGFHTLRHDALPALGDDELEGALRVGRAELEEAAGQPLGLISYPHGKADDRVADAAREAGFAHGFTTARGLVGPSTDPFRIPRTVPDLSAERFALRLARLFATRATAVVG